MPADLIEYEVRDNDGIRVKIWRAGPGLEDRELNVLTGWGEVEGVRESGITTTLLGRDVEILRGRRSYVVVLGRNPSVSLCQMIRVGSYRLTLEEFTQVVESVREVEP